MDARLLEQACKLYNADPDKLVPLTGGHANAVYEYQAGNAASPGIIRLGVQDCPTEQTLGMLQWVHFLSTRDAPVTAPVRSLHGNLLESLEHDGQNYIITAFEKATGTLAENIPPAEWTDDLFSAIGRAVGEFHAISGQYTPAQPALTRLQWYESYEVQQATKKLATLDDPARQKLAALLHHLKSLPCSPADYGLIHDDLHFANFLVGLDGEVTIIDFDDCGYGWFVIDVAMALFDVMVLYNPSTDEQARNFAMRFMHHYLSGYRTKKELPAFWQAQIPHFLKLKELCIYTDLIDHPDIKQADSWVGRFMRGRAERVANDIPYVDIDFMQL